MNHATPLIAVLATMFAAPLYAGHANPWATADDELVMQYHEENLAQSVDTPQEDAMLGRMTRTARGKIELDAGKEEGQGLSKGKSGGGSQGGGSGGKR